MTSYIQVTKWAEYQHYRDRNPPWIKLHRALLNSETWVCLDDASRVLAIVLMLLASESDNKIPNRKEFIKKRGWLSSEPDFGQLLETGFIEIIDEKSPNASNVLASRSDLHTNARPETETETETEERHSPAPKKILGYSPEFEALYQAFPPQRKGSRKNGFMAYKNAILRATAQEILNALPAYAASQQVADGYAQGLAAWLNDDGWAKQWKPKGSNGHALKRIRATEALRILADAGMSKSLPLETHAYLKSHGIDPASLRD